MNNQISAETLSSITYNSVPVITTELLACLYGTEALNIQVNHTRNKDRFVEGKHYFKATGNGLKDLRLTLSKSQNEVQISSKARSLILWTERGAARHAKMLETDQAWEVFERLEDSYFAKKAGGGREVGTAATFTGVLALYFEDSQVVRSEAVPGRVMVGTIDMFEKLITSQGAVVLWGEEQQRNYLRGSLLKML